VHAHRCRCHEQAQAQVPIARSVRAVGPVKWLEYVWQHIGGNSRAIVFHAQFKLPAGQGLWAAFWMMGVDAVTTGWPQCGEIDIMESLGHEPSTVHATIHGPGYSGADGVTRTYTLPDAQWLAADYHVFATEWSPNTIQFLIDGHVYHTVTPAELPKGAAWVFQHPFFLLLNLAVGGSLPGNPDATTVFPRQMLVDYVRVYQHRGRARMK